MLAAKPDHALQINMRIDTDTISNFNQADDWSCDTANLGTDPVAWDHVTIYQGDKLISGKEPG